MDTNKIDLIYPVSNKINGDPINASDWNSLSGAIHLTQEKINSLVDDIENIDVSGGGGGGEFPLKEIVLKNTKSFSSQLTQLNSIYIILDSFNLNNDTVTIPANSTLKFEKGSVSNGIIVLNNTSLEGEVSWSNVTISGSCSNDVLTPLMFGAKAEFTEHNNTERDTLGFENLARVIDNVGTISKTIYIPSGHYSISRKIVIMSGCKIYGNGEKSIIDCYNGSGGLSIGYTGNLLEDKCEKLNCTLTVAANPEDRSITVNDVSEINVGDYLILYDLVDGSFNGSRAYYRMSELVKVRAIEENTLQLYNSLYGTYPLEFGEGDVTTINDAPANLRITITKFFPQLYIISDITVVSHEHLNNSPETYYSFAVAGHCNSLFRNIRVENYGNSVAAYIGLGINYEVTQCIIRSYPKYVNDAYGLLIVLSQDFKVSHCTLYAKGHTLATGGNGNYYGINNRNFRYEYLLLEGPTDNQVHLDVHSNAEYYTFSNIVAPTASCDSGGIHVTIENCVFYRIWATFNASGINIRNCELMNSSFAEYLIPPTYVTEVRDIVMENNIIHGGLTYNFQNSSGTKPPVSRVIFNNNICKGLRLRAGKTNTIIIKGNIFTENGLTLELDTEDLQISDNIIKNGTLSILNVNNVYGLIYGNTILYNGEDTSKYLVYLNNFFGFFHHNQLKSIIPVQSGLLLAYGNSKVNIYDNEFKMGTTSATPSYMIVVSGSATVTATRNTHNSTNPSIINIASTGGGATMDKYNFSVSNNKFSDMNNLEAIGSPVYIRNSNKFGYFSNGKDSDKLFEISAIKDSPTVVENTLEKGKLYYVTLSRSGQNNVIYFSKTQEIVEEELLRATSERNALNQVIKAPDPTEYPFIYVTTSGTSRVYFAFYNNRNASEYDGAVFNVKRQGTSSERPIGRDIYVNFLYFDTDLNQMIYAKAIDGNDVTWELVGSRLETYNYVSKTSDLTFANVTNTDRVGNPIYVRNLNKLGYISNKEGGPQLCTFTASVSNPVIASNPFEKDKIYFVTFSRSEYRMNIYFSKTEEIIEENLLGVVEERYTENQVFKAPDPVEYPYIYITTLNNSNVKFNFYLNRSVSEYDGAAFNVKRRGTSAERPNGYDIYVGFEYFDTDIDNIIYAKAINENIVTWAIVGESESIKYNYMAATNKYLDFNNVELIGDVVYVRNQNKLGYKSNGVGSARLFQISVTTTTPGILANTLTEGALYYVLFSRNGYYTRIYFSKSDTPTETDLVLAAEVKNATNQVFKALNPTEYPYIYVTTADTRGLTLSFYENRNASEYDGSRIGVSRKGDTASRPAGTDINAGFLYFDDTLGKPIYAKWVNSNDGTVTWVDATGATV